MTEVFNPDVVAHRVRVREGAIADVDDVISVGVDVKVFGRDRNRLAMTTSFFIPASHIIPLMAELAEVLFRLEATKELEEALDDGS